MTEGQRRVVLVAHPGRPEAVDVAVDVAERLSGAGLEVVIPPGELEGTALG